MGNNYSQIKGGIKCFAYTTTTYETIDSYVHGSKIIQTRYFLPDRSLSFHVHENTLYVYHLDHVNELGNDINISKELYNKILKFHKQEEKCNNIANHIIPFVKNL